MKFSLIYIVNLCGLIMGYFVHIWRIFYAYIEEYSMRKSLYFIYISIYNFIDDILLILLL